MKPQEAKYNIGDGQSPSLIILAPLSNKPFIKLFSKIGEDSLPS